MKTEKDLIPWPWPFAQWDGTRWVMPMELAPKEVRKAAKKKPGPMAELADVEEAPF